MNPKTDKNISFFFIMRNFLLVWITFFIFSCAEPNPMDSYVRIPPDRSAEGNDEDEGDGAGGLFAKGYGTQNKPYMIMTAIHLQNMHEVLVNGKMIYFELGADIDMANVAWSPLNGASPYEKYIDLEGRNHVIKNFTCIGTSDYPSFFGVLCGECRNVGFEDAYVESKNQGSGIIAGYIGLASGDSEKTGRVINCFTTGQIKAPGSAGGIGGILCGTLGNATSYIKNTYSHATVMDIIANNSGKSGGIIGRARGIGGYIENCYATGDVSVSGDGNVGGIFGLADKGTSIILKNCIAWNNSLTGKSKSKIGRIACSANTASSDCYASNDIILNAGDEVFTVYDEVSPIEDGTLFHGIAKSKEELESIILAWDTSLWEIGQNGYPTFKLAK